MRSLSFISLMENPPLPPCQGRHLTNTCQLVACGQNKPFPRGTSPEDSSGLDLHPDPESHPITWAVCPPLPLLWANCSFSRPASYLFLLSMHLHVIYITLIFTFIHGMLPLAQLSWALGTSVTSESQQSLFPGCGRKDTFDLGVHGRGGGW